MFTLQRATLLLLCSPICLAQSSTYPDEAAVVLHDDVRYQYAADGTGTRTETASIRIQSAAALQNFSVLTFPYSTANQTLDILYARVHKPGSPAPIDTPTTDALDQPAPVTQAAPMYSDLHSKQLPVRSLAVGDTLDFQVRLTQLRPDIPNQFYGQESFGIGLIFLERTIELHVPIAKHVTVSSPAHSPAISESNGERVYSWKGSQLRSPSAKEDDPAPDTKLPPIAWTTFHDWEAVGLWYRDLIAGRDAVTPAIQARADELTAHSATDIDKIHALYDYVAIHIHYIGIDFGIGRLQPHTAAEVLVNQYGDCKDKHTLLAALLRAEGFMPSAVLIGGGIELNRPVPSPLAFNHLITSVDLATAPSGLIQPPKSHPSASSSLICATRTPSSYRLPTRQPLLQPSRRPPRIFHSPPFRLKGGTTRLPPPAI